eukprot:7017557-Prymnesium_polylepis.1
MVEMETPVPPPARGRAPAAAGVALPCCAACPAGLVSLDDRDPPLVHSVLGSCVVWWVGWRGARCGRCGLCSALEKQHTADSAPRHDRGCVYGYCLLLLASRAGPGTQVSRGQSLLKGGGGREASGAVAPASSGMMGVNPYPAPGMSVKRTLALDRSRPSSPARRVFG